MLMESEHKSLIHSLWQWVLWPKLLPRLPVAENKARTHPWFRELFVGHSTGHLPNSSFSWQTPLLKTSQPRRKTQLCEAVYPREEWAIYLSVMIKIGKPHKFRPPKVVGACLSLNSWRDETKFCSPYPKPEDFFFPWQNLLPKWEARDSPLHAGAASPMPREDLALCCSRVEIGTREGTHLKDVTSLEGW